MRPKSLFKRHTIDGHNLSLTTTASKRYFLRLCYKGTEFHGWQKQPGERTVQGTIEKALATVLGRPIEVIGCGRTDTGVHASDFFAHFDLDQGGEADHNQAVSKRFDPKRIPLQLDALCGWDIAFRSCFEVDQNDHSRFSATYRQYRYRMHFEKDPFLRDLSFKSRLGDLTNMNQEAMQEAARTLLSFEDFASFCKTNSGVDHTRCQIHEAYWEFGSGEWFFVIRANRFLRGMVRLITGTLLDIGKSRLTLEDFKKTIAAGRRFEGAFSVPAEGLYLEEIGYPDHILKRDPA